MVDLDIVPVASTPTISGIGNGHGAICGSKDTLLEKIQACIAPQDKIRVGLEATGHYSYNLLGFLLDNGLATYLRHGEIQAALSLSGLSHLFE